MWLNLYIIVKYLQFHIQLSAQRIIYQTLRGFIVISARRTIHCIFVTRLSSYLYDPVPKQIRNQFDYMPATDNNRSAIKIKHRQLGHCFKCMVRIPRNSNHIRIDFCRKIHTRNTTIFRLPTWYWNWILEITTGMKSFQNLYFDFIPLLNSHDVT